MTRTPRVVLAAIVLATTIVAGVGSSRPGRAATQGSGPKPVVPVTGSYLGAFVAGTEPDNPQAGQAATIAFDSATGRPLAIDNRFASFHELQHVLDPTVGGPQLDSDAHEGSIPMLSWRCDQAGPQDILSGHQDAYLKTIADDVAAYRHPVFIRYFWEMNLQLPINIRCLGGMGAQGYVAVWRHIWTIFQQEGATNAAFAWVMSSTAPGADAAQYYPGDQYVDWIGADGYSRNAASPTSFATVFRSFYDEWHGHKPLLVAETGVAGTSTQQAAWLQAAFAALPGEFPDIKAVDYFDSGGNTGNYVLADPTSLGAYAAGAASPYFAPMDPHLAVTFSGPTSATIRLGSTTKLGLDITATGFPVPLMGFSGTLPRGLSLVRRNDGTATLQGFPLLSGRSTVDITATDAVSGAVVTRAITVTVGGIPGFVSHQAYFTVNGLPGSFQVVTSAFPADRLTVTGLPAGFRFEPGAAGTGQIVGTPTAALAGVHQATVTATNDVGTVTQQLPITIFDRPQVEAVDAAPAYVGTPFHLQVGTAGYPAPSLSLAKGQLPAWLHLTRNADGTASLSGTPLTPTVFTVVMHGSSTHAGIRQDILYNIIVTVH